VSEGSVSNSSFARKYAAARSDAVGLVMGRTLGAAFPRAHRKAPAQAGLSRGKHGILGR
jgi:hypothetical protein